MHKNQKSSYPIMYLDCITIKVQDNKSIINKAIYLALGINTDGHKELLGIWISPNEGAKFWLQVLTEIKSRGVQDIFIACCDGLTGFPDAINAVHPSCEVQLCIVHMVRNSLRCTVKLPMQYFNKQLYRLNGSFPHVAIT